MLLNNAVMCIRLRLICQPCECGPDLAGSAHSSKNCANKKKKEEEKSKKNKEASKGKKKLPMHTVTNFQLQGKGMR